MEISEISGKMCGVSEVPNEKKTKGELVKRCTVKVRKGEKMTLLFHFGHIKRVRFKVKFGNEKLKNRCYTLNPVNSQLILLAF